MDKLPFDSGWEYTDEVTVFPAPPRGWRPVTLPHDAAISKPRARENPSGPAGGFVWSGVVYYRKRLLVPEAWRPLCVELEFEGVYMNAEVYVNGNLVTFHPYGYTSFVANIKPYLLYGAENEITVMVNNSAQPNSRWYTGTGIYRHVWLRVGGAVHIRPWGVFVRTVEAATPVSLVMVSTEIANSTPVPAQAVLRTTVLDACGNPVQCQEEPVEVGAHATVVTEQLLTVPGARLWSPADPHLYLLLSELVMDGGVVDAEKTTFGIRSISVSAESGFSLNGIPMKLRGGCIHHDHGLLGAASYDRAEERKVELLKAAGFNAIRTAHNPPAPALLDACDRLGMLVIDELFDCWRMGKNPNDYHVFFEHFWQQDAEAAIKRDRNHPSVIMWSIGNELPERTGASDGYQWCKKVADYVRSLDNTRPITSALAPLFEADVATSASGDETPPDFFEIQNRPPADCESDRWGKLTLPFASHLDVVGYNYLNARYEFDRRHYPERVICGTESFPLRAFRTWHDTLRFPNVIGDFVWTAFDYRGEAGLGRVYLDTSAGIFFLKDPWPFHVANCGDFDICGFKRPQSYFRDILWGVRKEPYIGVLHPRYYGRKLSFTPWGWEPVSDDWTFPGWEGKPTRVVVYCADEEVELVVNGVSLGRRPAGARNENRAEFEVMYEPGTITAIAFSGGEPIAESLLQTAGAPVRLRLSADRSKLRPAYGDLAYVVVEVVDERGVRVRAVDVEITVSVEGPADLIALGTSNPESEEPENASSCKCFEGRALAIVRANGQAGEVSVTAAAAGLGSASLCLLVGDSVMGAVLTGASGEAYLLNAKKGC